MLQKFGRFVLAIAVAGLVYAIPASAQITNGLTFTTSFPFYVGNAKMPAGSYKVTPSNIDDTVLLIQNEDGSHSAFIDYVPTESSPNTYYPKSEATFRKYGDTDFLNRLWVQGQQFGVLIEPTRAESKMAASANAEEHTLAASKLPGKGETADLSSH